MTYRFTFPHWPFHFLSLLYWTMLFSIFYNLYLSLKLKAQKCIYIYTTWKFRNVGLISQWHNRFHCDLENSNTVFHYLFEDINPFSVNVPFLYPFQKITDVFVGYRNETLAGDRLKRHVKKTYIHNNVAILKFSLT